MGRWQGFWRGLWLCGAMLAVSVHAAASESGYEAAVSQWTSYEDVANWLKENFAFDKSRQTMVVSRVKAQGPSGLLVRQPAMLYQEPRGFCADAAGFAVDALNSVDPEYNARYIFIKNRYGQPNHWVAGFRVGDGIYVMDYGAGSHWQQMMGVHGPYKSLNEYAAFLDGLGIKRFAPELVVWRDMPGQMD